MFHNKFWKCIYFVVKWSKITSHKNSAGADRCALVSAGFF